MLGYILLLIWVTIWWGIGRNRISNRNINISNISSNRYLIISSLGVVLLTGLRHYSVGPDSDAYTSYIQNLNRGIYLVGYDRFEKGFEILSISIAKFTSSYTIYFSIIAFIVMFSYGILLKKTTRSYFWGIFLYITIGPFIFQLTGLRQALAMALCAISVIYAKEKRIVLFFLLNFFATQFHASALIFIPFYFVGRIRPSLKSLAGFIVGSFIIIYANEWLLNTANTILGYEKGYEDAPGGYINIIIYLGIISASIFTQNRALFGSSKLRKYDSLDYYEKYNIVALNMTIICFLTYILRYWFRMAERGSKYYMIGAIVLLANYLDSIKDKKIQLLVKLAVAVLALSLFFYRQMRVNSQYIYMFFWQN